MLTLSMSCQPTNEWIFSRLENQRTPFTKGIQDTGQFLGGHRIRFLNLEERTITSALSTTLFLTFWVKG
jgi:hypothetical protein